MEPTASRVCLACPVYFPADTQQESAYSPSVEGHPRGPQGTLGSQVGVPISQN
jgi:hypothetical protein